VSYCKICAGAALALAACASTAQVAGYDGATGVLTIPTVAVGTGTYTNVTLLNTGSFVFTLQGATAQVPPGPGSSSYDAATGVLSVPAVKVGETTYLDVTLRNTGNFVFALQTATELPQPALDAVRAFLASADAQWATAVPASGSARVALLDGCWRSDGRTKAWLAADVDANLSEYLARDAYQIGRVSSNVQVLALRQRSNGDGSPRIEADVQYDVAYTDGTKALGVVSTIIAGSSFGTPGCTTPQSSSDIRFLGNQQLVGTAVRARNVRDERYSAATGAALGTPLNYRRSVQWQITDPMGNATYVVVTGPGPAATVGGVATQFSLKFVSPRLLRAAPELQGRPGNFLNWLDDDAFRFCRVAGGDVPVAGVADCTGQGATGFDWGITTPTPDAARDQSFAAQGWVAGGVYRFDVYDDDGWKTVGGHAGRTPIATYYATLERLPYTFVEMAAGGAAADKFPRLSFGSLTPAQVRADAVSATPQPIAVSWNVPPVLSDARAVALAQGWEFHQGPKVGNAAGAANPAYRNLYPNYPGSAATSNPAWSVTARPADQASKSYFEFTLLYSDRNASQIISIVSFQ
jgi:hypothetical protein